MQNSLKNSRALRWAVPFGAAAVVGAAIGTGPVIAAAKGDPSLPPKTAAELLVAAAQAGQLQHPLSGTIVENASLGLPPLPGDQSGDSLIKLLSGSHTARIWYADPRHVRLAQIDPGSELDYIRNGADAWEWSSARNTATHATIGDKQPPPPPKATLTPQQAADRALATVGKSTTVRVDPTGRVAGRDVYELVLSPKDARSLVGQVRVALDGRTFVPLRVQVYPRGSVTPAAQVGFTSVTYTRPAAANFAFRPPPGAKVVQRSGQAVPHRPGRHPLPRTIGDDWTTVVELNLPADAAKGGMTEALRRAMTPVPGGRVMRTKLFSVLLTDDGRLFAGAVTPDVLTQAAR
jgi:outer membrane lipoprotein-sorting protein